MSDDDEASFILAANSISCLLLFNLLYSPDFFSINVRNGHLYGSLIDILNFGSPLILVSIGMTLVIATKGIDLSVGSVVAISGAIACLIISKGSDQEAIFLVFMAVGIAITSCYCTWRMEWIFSSGRGDSADYCNIDSDGSGARDGSVDHEWTNYYRFESPRINILVQAR